MKQDYVIVEREQIMAELVEVRGVMMLKVNDEIIAGIKIDANALKAAIKKKLVSPQDISSIMKKWQGQLRDYGLKPNEVQRLSDQLKVLLDS
jgi:serine kinase of HPr protein (carbohydrate metabolism regulator)